ncbi:bifunctional DNA primase/polymerase [Microlunatus sp. Y2014]|uniref:bifunctional DNA primase/polymerase n=1 Tax=Microlunatus sp. Y2014 TaxID=3418488 RepID=UPI003DA75B0E
MTTLDAAIWYARRGWHVFPLRPRTKRPAAPTHRAADCTRTDPWCRSGHTGWEQRATTDRERITRAWSSHPDHGIGIACGPSRLLVIDTDTAKPGAERPMEWQDTSVTSGETVLAHLAADHGEIPDTWTIRTPSGGLHRYFHFPAEAHLGNTTGRLGWLIDTRGAGGYVAAAPTRLDTGSYRIDHSRPVAQLPAWLHQLLAGYVAAQHRPDGARPVTVAADLAGYVAAAVRGECAKAREAQPGQRNDVLFRSAVALGQLVAGNALPAATAAVALLDAAADHITANAYSEAQARATIRSGFTAGARTPRSAA